MDTSADEDDQVSLEISYLESMLHRAKGALRTALGEEAVSPPHRIYRPDGSIEDAAAVCEGGSNEAMLSTKTCVQPVAPPSVYPTSEQKTSVVSRSRRAAPEPSTLTRVPGASWSLSQTKRIAWLSCSQTSTSPSASSMGKRQRPSNGAREPPSPPPPLPSLGLRGQNDPTLLTRKRVPGFSIGTLVRTSSPSATARGERRCITSYGGGKTQRQGGGDGERKKSGMEVVRGATMGEGGATGNQHQQQHQQEAKVLGSRGEPLWPCRKCRNECWFECSCACHSSSIATVEARDSPHVEENFTVVRTAATTALPSGNNKQEDVVITVLAAAAELAEQHKSEKRRISFPTDDTDNPRHDDVRLPGVSFENDAGAAPIVDGVPSAASTTSRVETTADSVLSGNDAHHFGGWRRGVVRDGIGGGQSGADDERGEASRGGVPGDSLARPRNGDHCICAASCWFACSCGCHTTAESRMPGETTEVVDAQESNATAPTVTRDAGSGPHRSKRHRKEPELLTTQFRQNEGHVVQSALVPDLRRAFLVTSECGTGPRVIHLCTTPRTFTTAIGQRDGRDGYAAAATAATTCSGDSGRRMSYDASLAEAIIRPRAKGFVISSSARDPAVAKAESAAAAVVTMADRFTRAPGSTVGGSGPSRVPNAGGMAKGAAVGWDGGGKQQPAMPGVDSGGERELTHMAGSGHEATTRQAASGKETEATTQNDAEGATAGASLKASATSGEMVREEAEGNEDDFAIPAPDAKKEPSVTRRKQIPAPSPEIGETRAQRRESTSQMQQPRKQDQDHPPQHNKPLPSGTVGPAPIVSVCDEFLSHRRKARAVIFPRPHTHHARQRPARRHGQDVDAGLPGPGEYDIGMAGGRAWGAKSAKGPLVAPKRTTLKGNALVVVATQKAKEACLGGPGEYDIFRADEITRVRKVAGVLPMRPPPTSPTPHGRGGEAYTEKKARARDAFKKDGCGNRRAGSWGRSRSRSRNRSRPSAGQSRRRRCGSGGTSRSRARTRRRRRSRSSARGRRSPVSSASSSSSRDERKGGEEKEASSDCARRRRRNRGSGSGKSRRPSNPRRSSGRLIGENSVPLGQERGNHSAEPQKRSAYSSSLEGPRGRARRSGRGNAARLVPGLQKQRQLPRSDPRPSSRSASRGRRARRIAWVDENDRRRSRSRGDMKPDARPGGSRRTPYRGGSSREFLSSSSPSPSPVNSGRQTRGHRTSSSQRHNRGGMGERRQRRRRGAFETPRYRSSLSDEVSSESSESSSPSCSSEGSSCRRYRSRPWSRPQGHGRLSRRLRSYRSPSRGRKRASPEEYSFSSPASSSSSRRRRRRRRNGRGPRSRRAGQRERAKRTRGKSRARGFSSTPSSSWTDSGGGSVGGSDIPSSPTSEEKEIDGVWRGFLAVSRRVPGAKIVPLERKGVGDKNRRAVERLRLQRERERNVGYHDVRRSLTEERAPTAVSFAAQAEAMARERQRMLRRRSQAKRAWASECEDQEANADGAAMRQGGGRGQSADGATRKRPPVFRYVEEVPLSLQAARRQAERKAAEYKRSGWLEVNIHQKWVETPRGDATAGGGIGDVGGVEFGRAKGREETEVKRKGEAVVRPFGQALPPFDAMGPGRYETEERAQATRTGRLGQAPVPVMALGLAREEAVGPRGGKPDAAVDAELQETEGREGGVLVLDIQDDATTRGRRRVPGGVLPSAPRWVATAAKECDGGAREGEELDIEPEAGKDRLGPRRDKGHRYLRFETQVGRGDDSPPSAELLSPGGGTEGCGFVRKPAAAAEGDVLVLNPEGLAQARSGDADGGNGSRRRGTAVDLERQAPRWPGEETGDEGRGAGRREDYGECSNDGDVLVLDPDQGPVRRNVPGIPAFERKLGWRESQAKDALEREERLRGRREAWGWAEAGGRGGRGRGGAKRDGDGDDDDPVERADRGTRPRVVTLVNLEKQQEQGRIQHHSAGTGGNEDESPPSSEVAYRHADYDTDPGVSMTRPRAVGAVADMRRSTGRELTGWAGGREEEQRGSYSDGEGGGGWCATREGDELMLSPNWSFLATRPSQAAEWQRGSATPRFVETLLLPGRGAASHREDEGGQELMGGLDLTGVEAARAKVSRWRGAAVPPVLKVDMTKNTSRPSSLFGVPERHLLRLAPGSAPRPSFFSDDELRDDRLMEGQRLDLFRTVTGGAVTKHSPGVRFAANSYSPPRDSGARGEATATEGRGADERSFAPGSAVQAPPRVVPEVPATGWRGTPAAATIAGTTSSPHGKEGAAPKKREKGGKRQGNVGRSRDGAAVAVVVDGVGDPGLGVRRAKGGNEKDEKHSGSNNNNSGGRHDWVASPKGTSVHRRESTRGMQQHRAAEGDNGGEDNERLLQGSPRAKAGRGAADGGGIDRGKVTGGAGLGVSRRVPIRRRGQEEAEERARAAIEDLDRAFRRSVVMS